MYIFSPPAHTEIIGEKKYVLCLKAELYLLCDFIHSCILIQITVLISYPQANAFNCSALAESSVTHSVLGYKVFKNIQSVHLWI